MRGLRGGVYSISSRDYNLSHPKFFLGGFGTNELMGIVHSISSRGYRKIFLSSSQAPGIFLSKLFLSLAEVFRELPELEQDLSSRDQAGQS